MAALAPVAILVGALAALGLIFGSVSEGLFERLGRFGSGFSTGLEAAGMKIEPAQFVFVLAGAATAAWVLTVVLFRPDIAVAGALLAAYAAMAALGGRWYLLRRRAKRIATFQDQLENSLRTLAGGVRVGLGIRQALVLTSEQSREPAKSEFMRVVGLSNIGVSILDAFDQLATRMTNSETAVLARVIRVQAQTGGDLGTVLDGLAGTIRDRRRLRRRVKAVTAQGRATAVLLALLPVGVGCFVLTQEELRDAMLHTFVGQLLLAVSLGLDGLALFSLNRITKIDP